MHAKSQHIEVNPAHSAENSALLYFWWFMLLSAFTGTSFSRAFINGFNEGLSLGAEIRNVIESTAKDIPIIVSANWLNVSLNQNRHINQCIELGTNHCSITAQWMIVRTFAVLPTQYLLQLNTFVFTAFGLKCCARTVRGGGELVSKGWHLEVFETRNSLLSFDEHRRWGSYSIPDLRRLRCSHALPFGTCTGFAVDCTSSICILSILHSHVALDYLVSLPTKI